MTLDEPNPNPLIAGLGSADARKRENAANALIAAPDPSAEGPLIEALDDPEAGVRGHARSRSARSAAAGPCRVCWS